MDDAPSPFVVAMSCGFHALIHTLSRSGRCANTHRIRPSAPAPIAEGCSSRFAGAAPSSDTPLPRRRFEVPLFVHLMHIIHPDLLRFRRSPWRNPF